MDATAARWVPPPGAEEEQAGQSTTAAPRLCFPNTLTGGAKVPFVPLKPGRVTWYACGPTVYDSAHMVSRQRSRKERERERKRVLLKKRFSIRSLDQNIDASTSCDLRNQQKKPENSQGHARAYVSFDIVRRVLEDWFNLDVHLVMNVTDVDDKIIARARRRVVLDTYLERGLGDDGASYSSAPPSAAQVKRDASAAVALALERQELRLKRAQEAAKAEKGREGERAKGEDMGQR